MTHQTNAQRLAGALEEGNCSLRHVMIPAASELRRLSAIEQERDLLRAQLAAVGGTMSPSAEPFGYFRAEPFGWADCAETDDGAIALYERPQEVGLTDEERADMACAVAAICTGTSSRTVAATAIEWTERALRAKGQS